MPLPFMMLMIKMSERSERVIIERYFASAYYAAR